MMVALLVILDSWFCENLSSRFGNCRQQREGAKATGNMWFIRKILLPTFEKSFCPRSRSFSSISSVPETSATQKNPPDFSKDQEFLILTTINRSEASELVKFDIKSRELKKLITYREKNGEFQCFNDLLMTQDVPSLIKFCKSILAGGKRIQRRSNDTISKNFVVPQIQENERALIKSVLGLHLIGNTLSWTSLESNGRINEWNFERFDNSSKLNLVALVDLILGIISRLPNNDVYVMESDSYTSLSKMNTAAYSHYLMRQQVISTIVGVMKMRGANEGVLKTNNFYLLQPRSSAKLFKLNVGNEKISADSVVSEIIGNKSAINLLGVPAISIDPQIYGKYRAQDDATREQLNSALLLTLAFSNYICIKKNGENGDKFSKIS